MSTRKKIFWFGLFPLTILICAGILYVLITSILSLSSFIESNLVVYIFGIIFIVLDLVGVSGILIAGSRDALFQFCYLCTRKKELKKHQQILDMPLKNHPKVAMLYCTCNDLDEIALKISLKQDYDNFEFIILDDSSKPEYLSKVDAIAKENNLRVIRRENRQGFKAGNLNNYLKNHQEEYEYIVVLDSDERVPSNFIENALKYFENDEKLGAVQASHVMTKGNNVFQNLMGMHLKSDSQYINPAKNKYGFCSLFGHGMMLKKEALQKVGFFPEVVLEDFGMTLLLNEKGYEIMFSPLIVAEEEYPSNYVIAKKRQLRWQEGAVEIRRKLKTTIHSKNLNFYMKREIQIHLFQNYRTIYCILLTLFCPIFLALMGCNLNLSILSLISILIVAIQLLKDVFTYLPTRDFWKLPFYLILNAMVYSSYLPAMIVRVTWAELGKKPFFLVTAKGQHRVVALQILLHSLLPIIFVAGVGVLTYFAYNSLAPSLSIIAAGVLSPFFMILANIEFKEKKPKKAKVKKEAMQVSNYGDDVTV